MIYLYPNQILYLHRRVLQVSGGSPGVRDEGLLESAVYRPQASFGGSDLYPDLFSKAAAMGHSLIKNHAFIDGNKRTGFEAMRLFLRLNGWDLRAGETEKFNFVMRISSDTSMDEHRIARWLKEKSVPKRK